MSRAGERSPDWTVRRLFTSPAVWVFAVTFTVLAIHPLPECVACEYARPWGRTEAAYVEGSSLLTAWLIGASLAAGFWNLRKNWLVPFSIVIAHLATQSIGGVPFWSLWSNEGPVILALGLLVGAGSLMAGYLIHLAFGRIRGVKRASLT